MHWDYPVYLVPHAGGFASIVDPQAESAQLLVIYTQRDSAADFMRHHDLPGAPRPLRNPREFRWLLQALSGPVTQVAFDPQPAADGIDTRWSVGVQTLLEDHLQASLSPWNYPVCVIAQDAGFACIQGQSSDGRPLTAVALFTRPEKANAYLEASGESGTLCELTDVQGARRFLDSLALHVFAVAVDPVATAEGRSAKYCFDIATLLEKYLVGA